MKSSYKTKACRLCLEESLTSSVSLPVSVIADYYSNSANERSERFPLDLYTCSRCGHVQITEVVRKDILFNNSYTYKPSKSSGLRDHFESYGKLLVKAMGSYPVKSLDIGSNDGLFLSVLQNTYGTKVLGIDPAMGPTSFAIQKGIETIQSFFTLEKAQEIGEIYGRFDHISANNVFAHNDDLNSFAKGVSHLLNDGGVFSFEISYLGDITEKALVGTIFHEHLSHHSLTPLITFLNRHNLHLFDAHRVSSQGGALVCFASKQESKGKTHELEELLKYESDNKVGSSEYMDRFRENLITLKSEFCHQLNDKLSGSNRVIGFGASRSANLLIEFFQLHGILTHILDDNEDKVGKYLPYTATVIEKASEFRYETGDLVIPLAWIHSERIVSRLKSVVEPDCCVHALSFYPSLQYVSIHR